MTLAMTLMHVHVYGCAWTGWSLWWGNLYKMNMKIQILHSGIRLSLTCCLYDLDRIWAHLL